MYQNDPKTTPTLGFRPRLSSQFAPAPFPVGLVFKNKCLHLTRLFEAEKGPSPKLPAV